MPFFEKNPGVLAIMRGALPFPYSSPGGISSLFIHEGFHEFVQFGPLYGLQSPWKFNIGDFINIGPRSDTKYCLDLSNLVVIDDLTAMKALWTGLVSDSLLKNDVH